jgi:predicted cupin superfamily sugar epimerase
MNTKIDNYVHKLNLQPHPEGGWYSETYRSSESTSGLPDRFPGERSFGTAIYFLVPGTTFSAFHRIKSDELWHFYDGNMLEIFVIDERGELSIISLGRDIDGGQVFQAVVNAGHWFASRCSVSDGFSLVGCTVSPGFDFADFEMADRSSLIAEYPQHEEIVTALTR